mgnify:CR=1 FL=1
MKKFQFKLQRLLDIKEAREKEVQNELAAVLNIQNRERIRQQEYSRRIRDEREKFNLKLRAGKFSYSDALMFEKFTDFANRVIEVAQDRIESMEPEIQRVRERLVEASREKKVVQRLKERRHQEYLYDYNREMNKEYDDMNQNVYLRRQLQKEG